MMTKQKQRWKEKYVEECDSLAQANKELQDQKNDLSELKSKKQVFERQLFDSKEERDMFKKLRDQVQAKYTE